MTEALTWAAIIASLGSITTFITFWIKMGRDQAATKSAAESAKAISTAALGKVDILSAQLAEYKVEVARDFASASDLKDVERRLVSAVDNLGARFDRMAERLDRFLDRHSK